VRPAAAEAGDAGAINRRTLMQFRVSPKSLQDSVGAEQWQARVDLAAAHRLAYMHGVSEGSFNHLTRVVPGRSDRYYQIPFGTHWSEVTASTFMEVGIDDGKVKSGEGEVERSCYCIHAPIHKALPQAKAVFHTHMPHASALTRLEDPRIKEIGQTEVGLSGAIAYDDIYTGPALDPAEGARLAKVIGDKTVLFMANHGISTVGATVAEAYDKLYYTERAAQVQIYAMWTGQPLKQLPAPVVEKTRRDYMDDHLYKGPTPAQRHFDALKRILDRKETDYAT
jgi:ribulose-5-phosphate 4-epimerase/fuculose-1-phosphate aldolase